MFGSQPARVRRQAAKASQSGGWGAAFGAFFAQTNDALRRIRAVNELNALSDAHLRDIGVDRKDIGMAVDDELARLRRGDMALGK